MAPQCAVQRVEQYFQPHGAIEHCKGAVSQRAPQAAYVVARADLSWSHDDGGRGAVEPSKQLEDPQSRGLRGAGGSEGNLEVDDGDVDRAAADQVFGFLARPCFHGANAHGFKQAGGLEDRRFVPPAAVGQQQVETACWGSRR